MMKLNEALKKVSSDFPLDDVFYIIGAIFPEPDGEAFRFYHNPDDSSSYLIISKKDVVGDVHHLTDSERAQKGYLSENVYKIGIKMGTKVKSVDTTVEVIGETISAEMDESPEAMLVGRCKHTRGCRTGCCSYGRGGKCYCNKCCVA